MAALAKTRLAPSPTGALHLGNARTFLATWLLARQRGWKIVLRIEDLDGPRVKRGATQQAIDDLHWLGIDWDERAPDQSTRSSSYKAAVQSLLDNGRAYPCVCTRSEVEHAASAPHAEDGAACYPGTCRGKFASLADAQQASGRPPAIRFEVPTEMCQWQDGFAGAQFCDVAHKLGDFVIAKADGTAAYQLAVVVDDAAEGITNVVRADDLLDSTPRQRLLYQALNMADQIPHYFHLPLVIGPDGRRLAKRHGDTRLTTLRADGVTAARVLTMLAHWLGIDPAEEFGDARQLVDLFDLGRIPREPLIWDPATACVS